MQYCHTTHSPTSIVEQPLQAVIIALCNVLGVAALQLCNYRLYDGVTGVVRPNSIPCDLLQLYFVKNIRVVGRNCVEYRKNGGNNAQDKRHRVRAHFVCLKSDDLGSSEKRRLPALNKMQQVFHPMQEDHQL